MTHPRSSDSPDHEAIAARAYLIWQRRGCPQGSAESDWLEAEAQLRAERPVRLDATASTEAAAPVETVLQAAPAVAQPPEGEAQAPKRRRRATAAATATPSTGTRVVRKRPARPDA
jgi:hypothetical protein